MHQNFPWIFNACAIRKVSKVPRFCYGNLVNFKEDGLLKSEDLNLKFCSPTDTPGNNVPYFSKGVGGRTHMPAS